MFNDNHSNKVQQDLSTCKPRDDTDEDQTDVFMSLGGGKSAATLPLPGAPEFLKTMFGDRAGDVQVCGFQGDPDNKATARWGSGDARDKFRSGDMAADASGAKPNIYFVPFLFEKGATRSKGTFESAVLMPVDDVGEGAVVAAEKTRYAREHEAYLAADAAWKAAGEQSPEPVDAVKRRVKIAREPLLNMFGPPTLAMVTSRPDGIVNEQWFYRLDAPCADRDKVEALLRALGSDAKDLARYVRLPGGANHKPKLGQPFDSVLGATGYDPSRTFNIDAMIARAKADVAAVAAERQARATIDPNAPESPYFRAMEKAGELLGPVGGSGDTARAHWYCCMGGRGSEAEGGWIGATEGHVPDEAKVWENGGHKCFHGTCLGKRNFNDLALWVEKHYPKELKEAKQELGLSFNPLDERGRDLIRGVDWTPGEDIPLPDDYTPPSKTEAEAVERQAEQQAKQEAAEIAALPPLTFTALAGPSAPKTPIDDPAEICAFFARRELTLALGHAGVGKSLYMLTAALAIAANRPDLIGEKSFDETQIGDVLYISNEDDRDVMRSRVRAAKKAMGLTDADFAKHDVHVMNEPNFKAVRMTQDGVSVELTPAMAQLSASIGTMNASGHNVCMVVGDTLTTILDGIPENDNNPMGNAGLLLTGFARANGVSFVTPHHMTKQSGKKNAGEFLGARGATAFAAAARRAFTTTELDGKAAASLTPDMLKNSFVVTWAKGNHTKPSPPAYFEKRGFPVEVRKVDGTFYDRDVVAAVPFTPDYGWKAESDNAAIAVLSALLDSSAKGYTGPAMRVKGREDIKSAAQILAEGSEDAHANDMAKTLKVLEKLGRAAQVPGVKHENGKAPRVWEITPAGKKWLAEKRAAVFTPVDDDAADTGDEAAD